jgi:hypothetical protein
MGCSGMKAMYLFIHTVRRLGRRFCLHLNLCLHRTRGRERRLSIHVPIGISLRGPSVQAVEDTFRCKLWNCKAFVNSDSVPPPFPTIQEIGTFQFLSHRCLTQKCPIQMADIRDTVGCTSLCSLEMYFRFLKLCLVCSSGRPCYSLDY